MGGGWGPGTEVRQLQCVGLMRQLQRSLDGCSVGWGLLEALPTGPASTGDDLSNLDITSFCRYLCCTPSGSQHCRHNNILPFPVVVSSLHPHTPYLPRSTPTRSARPGYTCQTSTTCWRATRPCSRYGKPPCVVQLLCRTARTTPWCLTALAHAVPGVLLCVRALDQTHPRRLCLCPCPPPPSCPHHPRLPFSGPPGCIRALQGSGERLG